MNNLASVLIAGVLLLPGGGALAQSTRPATQVFPRAGTDDRDFSVSPALADAPDAAPRGALWPDPLTRTPENAATLYLAAMVITPNFWQANQRLYEMDQRLQDATPRTINTAEAEEYLSHFQRPFQIIAPAAHRPRVQWDWPWREQGNLVLLPHLNQMRYLANVLTYRLKLDLSRGRVDPALDTLRQMYAMAAHAGAHDQAVLVEGLIGVGIAAQATSHLRLVVEYRDSPSLYHALRALPEPMFAPRTWVEMEHRLFRYSLPSLYEPEDMNEAAWIDAWRMLALLGLSEAGWKFSELAEAEQVRVARTLAANRRDAMLPLAIEYFSERGADAEALRSEAQANPYPLLARYMTESVESHLEEAAVMVQLPYQQALPLLRDLAEKRHALEWTRAEPAGKDLDYAFDRGLASLQRLRQRIALAVVLEALRDHAARHGTWPDSLEKVELALPDNPMTGRPFEYVRDGRQIILQGTGDPDRARDFQWRVTLRDKPRN